MARLVVGAGGLAVLGYAAGLVFGAEFFPPPGSGGALKQHVILLVVATMGATALYVGACIAAHRTPPKLRHVLIVAVAARLILLFGGPGPILEGDRDRIRFEGRMVTQGLNPYEFTPIMLADARAEDALLDDYQLARLRKSRAAMTASNAGTRPTDVRRPDLRTSTTPLGMWIAAAADFMKPESGRGYAFLILCADTLAGFFLILALRHLGLPLGWLLFYAWCPVLLKEAYCTYSIDVFVVAGLAGVVYAVVRGWRLFGAFPLAVCVALRPAMVLLLPGVGRRIGALGALLALCLSLIPALLLSGPDVPAENFAEGHVHVWRHYEYNSAAESVFRGVFQHVPYRAENTLAIAGVEIVRPGERFDVLLAKVACLVVLLGVVTYTVIRVRPDADLPSVASWAALTDIFVVIVALMVVSPVLMPNHALWLLPLLVVRPRGVVWLALPGILCLSHLTHLVGPDAADLTLAGGRLSFRVFEFALFLGLLVVDFIWRGRLFIDTEDVMARRPAPRPKPALDEYEHDPELVELEAY